MKPTFEICSQIVKDLKDNGTLSQDIEILKQGMVVKSAIIKVLPDKRNEYIFIGNYMEIYIFLQGVNHVYLNNLSTNKIIQK